MESLVGQTLSHYRIVEKIGAGGMGEVYCARDTRVGREVALKILPRDLASDPQRRRRFEQEARLAAALNHPNIVGLYDVGPFHDPPFIVTELVPGVSLRALMDRGPVPLRKALDLVAQVAEGLAAAHTTGVVHRDIKPENVMVTPEGGVKILDFGLARLQGSSSGELSPETSAGSAGGAVTSPGTVVGTVSYMSPEQASGQPVDYRTDQFSLGLVLYELCARHRPFDRATPAQTMTAIIEAPAPALGVPTEVRWVLNRCLAKDPGKRYASTLDLARSLRGLSDHAGELTPASGETAAAVRRRSPWRTAGLVACAVILLLVALSLRALYVDVGRVSLRGLSRTAFATLLRTSEWPSWSPDGRSIAFHGWAETEAAMQVWVQGLDASTPTQLTRTPFAPSNAMTWSSDSRMVYCPGALGSVRGIFRIPVAGGKPVLVQSEAIAGAVSPDGGTIVMLAREGPGKPYGVWWASPPEAPRRPYEPSPITTWDAGAYPQVAFSRDGAKVLVAVEGAAGSQCWLLPWPQGQGRRIRGFEDALPSRGISWMPDSRHVVSGTGTLFMGDVRTGRHWRVLVGGGAIGDASLSPDGRRIAFATQGRHTDLIEMPLHGGDPRTLVGTRRDEAMPALSADGKELVFGTTARGPAEAWSMDMRSGSFRRLLAPRDIPADSGSGVDALINPVLSADRRRVAVEAVGRGKRLLYIAFTAGAAPVRATAERGAVERAPTWSPAGDRLAYIADAGATSFLQVVRPGGADRPARIWEGQTKHLAEWSPTGEWIALSDTSHVVLVSPDGATKRDLGAGPGPLAWAPDGRTLYVVHVIGGRGWVGAIDVRSGAERRVRDLGDQIPDSFLSPGLRISATHDGRALIYAIGQGGGDIWLLEGVRTPGPLYRRLWPWGGVENLRGGKARS